MDCCWGSQCPRYMEVEGSSTDLAVDNALILLVEKDDSYQYKFIYFLHILPQSSGYFDPGAHLNLKKPPDPSEIYIRRNLRKPRNSQKLYKEIIRNLLK